MIRVHVLLLSVIVLARVEYLRTVSYCICVLPWREQWVQTFSFGIEELEIKQRFSSSPVCTTTSF